MTAQTAQNLIAARNSASSNLSTLIHLATGDVASKTGGARQALAAAASAHASLVGTPPDDAEALAAAALLSAAAAFIAAAQAAQATIGKNWCPPGSAIADALKAANA